ncbi:MAG TPA: Clp protease N-terminal domain-containing protein [Actinomycetota bacterium]|nr:Clp protease N-terminal domain-containing protein [Actinomycetota bacterium]
MFERFTSQARSVVTLAQQEARELGRPNIGTQHLLLGILGTRDTSGARALEALGIHERDVREDVRRLDRDRSAFSDEDADALRSVGIDLDEVRRTVEQTFGSGALEGGATAGRSRAGHVPLTPGSKKAFELALREAIHLGHRSIGTEHLLLGLVRDDGSSAARILAARDADRERVRTAVLRENAAGGDRPGRTA